MMTLSMIMTGIVQGLILSLMSYAVMIPFRIVNLPDVSAEGWYPLVGAITAVLMGTWGVSGLLVIPVSAVVGALGGVIVGLVITKLRINSLLAGIIISTMAYSVTLRIMGKPNIALNHGSFLVNDQLKVIIVIASIVISMTSCLYALLHTQIGLRIRAVGYNPLFARRNGISIDRYILLGLAYAGMYTGLAGCCIVQLQRYMDINIGMGICIHALAALMIGETLVGTKTLLQQLIAPLLGALVYQQIQGLAFSYGLAPSDLKFFTGLLVLGVIAIGSLRKTQTVQ